MLIYYHEQMSFDLEQSITNLNLSQTATWQEIVIEYHVESMFCLNNNTYMFQNHVILFKSLGK